MVMTLTTKAMLARKVEDKLTSVVESDDWVAERKYDGQRFIVAVQDKEARAFSRKGDELVVPTPIAASFDHPGFQGRWMFDGELVDEEGEYTYYIFDLLCIRDLEIKDRSWEFRRGALDSFASNWKAPANIRFSLVYCGNHKAGLLRLAETNPDIEGVVFKRVDSKYESGKSHKWLKHKITDTCDAFVTELYRKGKDQAVSLGLYHNGEIIEAGGLKIPADLVGELELDTVLEIEYLYSTNDNKLYQPVFLGLRPDKDASECTTDQLKR